MASFVINRSTHLIFHTELNFSRFSPMKDTWNGTYHASVCSAACFQVLRKHLLQLVYPKAKRIKSVFLLIIAWFVIDILILASH